MLLKVINEVPWSVFRSCIFSWLSSPPLHAWVGSWNKTQHTRVCFLFLSSSENKNKTKQKHFLHRRHSRGPGTYAGTSFALSFPRRRRAGRCSPRTRPRGTEMCWGWTSRPRRCRLVPGSAWTRSSRSSKSQGGKKSPPTLKHWLWCKGH